MLVIIGICVVIFSVFGGFILEKGNLSVLIQPAELIIIFGAVIGSLFISSPPRVVSVIFKHMVLIVKSKANNKEKYLELLTLLYQLFSKIRKEGLISIESDIESPDKSAIFTKYGSVLASSGHLNFICDNLKVIITTNVPPHELDSLMDLEIETRYHEAMIPSRSIAKIADALPGLGIVAAVLGVVLTMGKIDQPPAILGHSVGAALVGTFLGVLMSYGFVGPMATNLEYRAGEDDTCFKVIKIAVVAFVGGSPPQMAVEFGRRAISGKERPSFDELEDAVRGKGK
jgi:chemotaxis protein MotA